jgi:hypothetical protein
MLSHSWTYQALVHDVLEMKLNRVSVDVSPPFVIEAPVLCLLCSLDRTGEREDAEKVL